MSSLIIVGCTVVIHSVHRTTELDFDCGKENKKEKKRKSKVIILRACLLPYTVNESEKVIPFCIFVIVFGSLVRKDI